MFTKIMDPEITSTKRYRHAAVRDLAWVIGSPPLLEFPSGNIHWPNANWYHERYHDSADMLQRLDQDPGDLVRFLQHNKHHRLGACFEAYWIYWLQHQQRFQLLQHNLQINDAQRTIGEFDLIVHDTLLNKTYHWEVAVKFYLGIADTHMLKNWVGPGLQDRFDTKLNRLLQHQAILSDQPASKQTLQDYAINIDATSVILKGRLFYPIDDSASISPEHASSDHLKSWWCDIDDFRNRSSQLSTSWYALTKHEWLSPVYGLNKSCTDAAEIIEQVNERQEPVCVASINANEETSRGFIVPQDWTRKAERYSA